MNSRNSTDWFQCSCGYI